MKWYSAAGADSGRLALEGQAQVAAAVVAVAAAAAAAAVAVAVAAVVVVVAAAAVAAAAVAHTSAVVENVADGKMAQPVVVDSRKLAVTGSVPKELALAAGIRTSAAIAFAEADAPKVELPTAVVEVKAVLGPIVVVASAAAVRAEDVVAAASAAAAARAEDAVAVSAVATVHDASHSY